jgi:glyoxylase-like metal-dependent hydrolase (beta-lactamase superfamily II)/rhodanese-related sulfurtransferase
MSTDTSTRTPDVITDGGALVLHQYQLGCLSQLSYLVGDRTTGRAVVVDPRRDVGEYLADAEAEALTIELVVETHFHADFLSGHLELADATGAAIAYGQGPETEFPSRRLTDGEVIDLGTVTVEVRATPGHTPESISLVVTDTSVGDAPAAVLTGDTLYIGDVGRPDLLASAGISADELAGSLYDSLHGKLMTLPDQVLVLPAHGAGSSCGKNLSTATVSTIGEQRSTNYALGDMERDRFVEVITEGQPAAPGYFGYDARLNRQARELLTEEEAPRTLTLGEVLAAQREGAIIVDTRDAADFAAGHLADSISVGLGGRFAETAGSVLAPDAPLVLVGDPATEIEAKVRLGRIGFDTVIGSLPELAFTLAEHPEIAVQGSRLTVSDFERASGNVDGLQVVDVRNPGEVAAGAVEGAALIPLARLGERIDELDPEAPTVVYCAGGYRSAVAASLLRAAGFTDVSDLLGGYDALVGAGSTCASGR